MAEKIMWHSPFPSLPLSKKQGVPNPILQLKPYWAHPAMMIYADRTVSQADDQWINTGLSGLSDQTITGLLFHYQTQDIHSATAIRCVRLTEVNSPTTSTPNHIINEQTNLASPATGGPAVYRKMFAPRKINGVLALQLQMMIGGPAPSYFALLGGIGVTLA